MWVYVLMGGECRLEVTKTVAVVFVCVALFHIQFRVAMAQEVEREVQSPEWLPV